MQNTKTLPFVDRLLSWSFRHPISAPQRYAAATVLTIAIGLFRALVITSIVPWLLFIPVVLAIGLVLGRGPGTYAGVLAAIVAGLSIGSVRETLWLTNAQWVGSILFVLVTTGIAVFSAELRAAFARARQLTGEKDEALAQLAERESFLSGVLSSSTDCIKILDLDARLTFMSDGGQKVMEVSDFNTIAGCPWPDFWQNEGNAQARAAIAAAKAGQSRSFIGQAATMGGTDKWWHVAVSPIMGADGRPQRILSVSRDISDLRASEEERDRFVRLAENSTDFVAMARTDGSVFYLNGAGRRMVGLDADAGSLSIADFFAPEEAAKVAGEVLPAVVRDGQWTGEIDFRDFRTGEPIPTLYSVFPITDAGGALVGYGTVTRDFRERKRAENDLHLMNGELAHRLKNVLAVIQSVAQQTLRNAPDTESASQDLSARLAALGAATDVLTGKSWRSADLRELTERALAPHGLIGRRIVIDGPAVTLKPEVTVAFALALHELATNASKYGALSNEAGTVALKWTLEGDGEDARLALRWEERGGPEVAAPERKGFGSTLIERSLRSYFRGQAATDYRPEGLVFQLDARLGDAAIVTGK
ncbi:HWE histidine kinase domain-containing protein [Sphingomonas profundi]|uniref:HWE histidine kinase domain-containing protein n=1 Tax=Alterirhizorhabdus profundi TaxID=2681549 RepID=UPI0012E8626F|nr:HWE histidine kinase domain-containing protein [Sphingomonas profundi]